MAGAKKSDSKPKGRKGKLGKKKRYIAAYYGNRVYEHNKRRRIQRHLRSFPNDLVAGEALKRFS